jgi:MFS family permease
MTIDSAGHFSRSDSRLQRAAAPLLFLLLGAVFATWAARIPAIRDALQLNAAQLGVVLLCGGIGAVLSFPLAAGLVGHFGARRAAWYAGLWLLLMVPALAWSPSAGTLMAAMTGLGAAASCFDVAINAVGAAAEKAAGRSIMSRLHAWFCVGMLAGSLFGSAMAAAGIAPALHFGAVALMLAVPLALGYAALPADRPGRAAASASKKRFAMPHGPLVALGVICFCGAMAEGSITDWSGVFMKDQLHTGEGVAPLAFAAFSALMLAARLVGDRLKDRFGARLLVGAGAALAGCGMLLALLAIGVAPTIAGFALAGAGLAGVFPFVFSAAGRHGPTALAAVASMGYSGGLFGPPVIGFIAQGFGMQAALGFIGLLCLAIAVAAWRARWLE